MLIIGIFDIAALGLFFFLTKIWEKLPIDEEIKKEI